MWTLYKTDSWITVYFVTDTLKLVLKVLSGECHSDRSKVIILWLSSLVLYEVYTVFYEYKCHVRTIEVYN